MVDQNVLARLHLSAVLQNLEDVVKFDQEAKSIARDWNHTMQFSCPGNIAATIRFSGGNAKVTPEKTTFPDVALWFPTPTMLNRMFIGQGFTIPIPWMGVWKIALLKGFTALSKRMEHYLKPSEQTLADRKNFEFHVQCLLHTVVFGLKAVGENDPKVNHLVTSTRDGVAEFRIKGGPAAHIVIDKGRLFPHKGPAANPSAVLELKDYDTAFGLFTGKLDAMALMGACDVRISGYVPIIDNLNAALDRLAIYLS
jgi:hypothetical protein